MTAWRRAIAALLGLLAVALAGGATAHEVRPALLQITEQGPNRYDVLWKQPTVGDLAVHLVPHLSGGALDRAPDEEVAQAGFRTALWRVKGQSLDGRSVSVEGLSDSVTDVLIRVSTTNGKRADAVLRPSDPPYRLELSGPQGLAVPAYLRLGVEHILTGFDHLLFVFGLFLLVGVGWRLVKAITAFTVAHTITLGLAALGYLRFPSATIEALVALSIVFVACELVADPRGAGRLAHRHPWVIAFSFGLLHGMAFAGALAEVGLPRGAAPQALFLFNLGVEIGQLTFVGAVIAAGWALRRLPMWRSLEERPWAARAPAYLIGVLSAYWLVERVLTAATVTSS